MGLPLVLAVGHGTRATVAAVPAVAESVLAEIGAARAGHTSMTTRLGHVISSVGQYDMARQQRLRASWDPAVVLMPHCRQALRP